MGICLRADGSVDSVGRQIGHTVRNEIDIVLFVDRFLDFQFGPIEVVATEVARQTCCNHPNDRPGQNVPPVVSIVDYAREGAKDSPRGGHHLTQRKSHSGRQLRGTFLQVPNHKDRSVDADRGMARRKRFTGIPDEVRPIVCVGTRVRGNVFVPFTDDVRHASLHKVRSMFASEDLHYIHYQNLYNQSLEVLSEPIPTLTPRAGPPSIGPFGPATHQGC